MTVAALGVKYTELETLIKEIAEIDNEMGNDLSQVFNTLRNLPQETPEEIIEMEGLLEAFTTSVTTLKNKAKAT